jgi:hypothetical protein
MRWTERIIAAHKRGLSERPPDRRGELIARWERLQSGGGPELAVDLALELVTDGNANEVELGFHVLMDLALTEPRLRAPVRQLASHRSAAVRRGLAFYLSRELPAEFQSEVYGALLRDKAASVREYAITRIGTIYFKDLLPELRALRSSERNDKVIRCLDYWVPLLEVGYRVVPAANYDGMLEVTALTGNGTATKWVKASGPQDPQVLRAVEDLRIRGSRY